jgi:uncharacterized coiled-coil protein SlyX
VGDEVVTDTPAFYEERIRLLEAENQRQAATIATLADAVKRWKQAYDALVDRNAE